VDEGEHQEEHEEKQATDPLGSFKPLSPPPSHGVNKKRVLFLTRKVFFFCLFTPQSLSPAMYVLCLFLLSPVMVAALFI